MNAQRILHTFEPSNNGHLYKIFSCCTKTSRENETEYVCLQTNARVHYTENFPIKRCVFICVTRVTRVAEILKDNREILLLYERNGNEESKRKFPKTDMATVDNDT